MKPTFFKGAMVGGIAGAVCAAATVAAAGTGIGGVFNLGVDNTVDAQTVLRGNIGGNPQLRVNNQAGTDGAVAVLGVHSAAAGMAAAVQGDTNSTAAGATGVFGRVAAAGAAGDSNGVKGINNGAGRGVYGQGSSGPGVYGNSKSQYGVWGIGSYGVVAGGSQGGVWATTDNGAGSGVYGQNTGANGTGVRGYGGNGGWFTSRVSNGTGVLGTVTGAGHGVRGEAGAGGTGVYGKSTGGWAAQFEGDVKITRYLTLGQTAAPPPAQDCDEAGESGRLVMNYPSNGYDRLLWVCRPPWGWEVVDTH